MIESTEHDDDDSEEEINIYLKVQGKKKETLEQVIKKD